MNWGEIPQEMLDASAQVRKAQENLEKTVNDEITRRVNLHCQMWRMKVARLIREREALRAGLESAEGFVNCPQEIKTALELIRQNDSFWFVNTTARDYLTLLEGP